MGGGGGRVGHKNRKRQTPLWQGLKLQRIPVNMGRRGAVAFESNALVSEGRFSVGTLMHVCGGTVGEVAGNLQ